MAPIRVLFTIPNLDTAGSGRALARVIQGFDPDEVRATVCVNRPGGGLVDEFEAAGIELIVHSMRLPLRPRSTLPKRIWATARPLRGRYDIWHSYDYRDDYTEAIAARVAGARWVYTKKNMSWNHRSWWLRTMLASGIAVQNQDMLRDFFTGPVLGRHARYVPRGIAVGPEPDPALGAALRAKLGIPAEAPIVACVAQVIPRKGQLLLAQALADLPDVHVLLAGAENDAGYAERVRAAVVGSGAVDRVHWLGHVRDIEPVLAAADLFSLPTTEQAEGCPVALLEAMAAGRAVVATDVPGSRDIVAGDEYGRIVPKDDVPALAKAIRSLLDDPATRASVAAAGRARVATAFDLDHEVRAHTALYREIVGRSRRRSTR